MSLVRDLKYMAKSVANMASFISEDIFLNSSAVVRLNMLHVWTKYLLL